MQPIDAEDKRRELARLERDKIDPEFLPYLDRINALPFVVTGQCCIGHMEYRTDFPRPANDGGKWGYLQMLLTSSAADWLNEQICDWDWLWVEGSQLWAEGADTPGVTDGESYQLTFAWDKQEWPIPADDIVAALGKFSLLQDDDCE